VNIAIPNMIDKLHASLDDVLWVLNAYALVLAVLVISAGRLGDLVGTRTMFALGITVFTAASAACGFAPGPGWLTAFRSVQGLGAAMLMLQTLAIVTMTFPPARRGVPTSRGSRTGHLAMTPDGRLRSPAGAQRRPGPRPGLRERSCQPDRLA
jgi:MFS family permease